MRLAILDIFDLERQLLRSSVRTLAARRSRCGACHRTPLVGERLHEYEDGRVLCELCRAPGGETPVRSARVHGPEHGHAVRLRAAA